MELPEIYVIQLQGVSKTYQKGKNEVHALTSITLNIFAGEFISIVGKSGSGKSTLLNLIGGLDHVSNGNILFEGKNLSNFNRKEMAHHRKFSVGMIFQSFNLIPSRNVTDNVSLALAFGGMPIKLRKPRSEKLLTSVGLEQRLTHFPTELSGGEAQRVAVARALANDPKIILADEPTGNLDSHTSSEIIQLLTTLNKNDGKTVIMVTHDLETAEMTSDRIIKLKDGKQTDGNL